MSNIIDMARKARFNVDDNALLLVSLTHFADLVRADEREANAKVCEEMERDYWQSAEDQNNFTPIDCANVIRSRGQE